ncbi:MAG: DUF1847 domain-containing protein [Planctomycetes bacterium]|nr:DUF1847 domain-containing protein [Planctomycetota bacterium]
MPTCAHCTVTACRTADMDKIPQNCPMRDGDAMAESLRKYRDDGLLPFFQAAAAIEAEGYCQWPRLREVGEFCQRMGYRRIGVAFCIGLQREARVVVDVLRRYGVEVDSVICKAGGVDKAEMGISQCHYVRPGTFEAMCNPIAQAEFLNQAGSEFNVLVGLCVGHDSLFIKYSAAPVTTLVAKDRVLAHNPVGAIYGADGYQKSRVEAPDQR